MKLKSNTIVSAIMIFVLVMLGMVLDEFMVMFGISDVVSFDIAMTRTTMPMEVMLSLISIVVILSIFLIGFMMKNLELKTYKKDDANSNEQNKDSGLQK